MLDLISNDSAPATLPIAQIRRDGGTQPRQGMDEDAVNDYANALRNGERLPAVDVMFDGAAYWLFDGFHRTEAHLRAGLADIAVTIHRGTLEDAQWRSFGANKGHGLRRSNADKERAVRAALRHANGVGLSNVQIARHVGVDDKTVARYRAEMELTSEIPKSDVRTGVDGRVVNVASGVELRLRDRCNKLEYWLMGKGWVSYAAPSGDEAVIKGDHRFGWQGDDLQGRFDALKKAEKIEREQPAPPTLTHAQKAARFAAESAAIRQANNPPQPSPGPAAPAADPAVPLFPPSPSMPADLAARGWELRQISGVGKWWAHDRTGMRATGTYEDPADAIAEAYSLLRTAKAPAPAISNADQARALGKLYQQVIESIADFRRLTGDNDRGDGVIIALQGMIRTLEALPE